MLKKVQNARQHWGEVDTILNRWLLERQNLIAQYCHLSRRFTSNAEARHVLSDFCEVLMDYLSAGHFEIFSELEAEARTFDARGIHLVQALYPYLQQSTEIALAFNDECQRLIEAQAALTPLRAQLSYLGECLTDRFELEDQLIEYVHTASAPKQH